MEMPSEVQDMVDNLLKFDGIDIAERITGKTCNNDEATEALGVALSIEHNHHKNEQLKKINDTYMGISFDDFLIIAKNLGFEAIYEYEFEYTSQEYEFRDEKQIEMFNYEHSILLIANSFSGRLNRAEMYYNWKPHVLKGTFGIASSGGMISKYKVPQHLIDLDLKEETYKYFRGYMPWDIWCGHHDVREAFMFKFNRLLEHGKFVKLWLEKPFLWLHDYVEQTIFAGSYSNESEYLRNKLTQINHIDHWPDEVKMRVIPIVDQRDYFRQV
jgi:hypothetical protein